MSSELVVLVEEAPEGGYTARALDAAIFTEGDDFEEIESNVSDAVHCHFDEHERPKVVRLHFVSDSVVAV